MELTSTLAPPIVFFFDQAPLNGTEATFTNHTLLCPPPPPRSDRPPDILHDPVVRALLIIFYFVVFCVAVSGNSLVVYVVASNKKMHTVTNLFITNLALSDLLVNFTSLWLTPTYIFVGSWIWGENVCRSFPLFQGMSIFISILTLMAIAVDRYLVIVHHSVHLSQHLSMKKCIGVIVSIWILAFSLTFPYAYHMKLTKSKYSECEPRTLCGEEWGNNHIRTIYGAVVLILQFVVPFIIIFFSYFRIWTFLQNRRWASERTVETRRRKRLLTMLIIMVVVFAVCWIPMNTMNIIRDLGFRMPQFLFLFMSGHAIAMTATCWNPILYAWMNEYFREEFIRAIPFLRRRFTTSLGVKMISECQPASHRVNCNDAPTVSARASFARYDTVLTNVVTQKEESPETALL